jgi:hypothetical protein
MTRTTGDVVGGKFTATLNGMSNSQIIAKQNRMIIGRNVVSPYRNNPGMPANPNGPGWPLNQ